MLEKKEAFLKIYTPEWIVKHFSHPGDYVIDLFSTKGNCTVAAMKNFRNSAYFGTDKDTFQPSVLHSEYLTIQVL